MKEIWKDVRNYEGFYQISNKGNVKSVQRKVVYSDGRVFNYPEKILKPSPDTKGYLGVGLNRNGTAKPKRVHRLVAEAFLNKPEGLMSVNHIDGVKTNNNLSNLEWVTYSENTKKGYELGLFDKSIEKARERLSGNQYGSKPVILEIKATNEQLEFNSARNTSRYVGQCQNYFTQLLRRGGENKKYKIMLKQAFL